MSFAQRACLQLPTMDVQTQCLNARPRHIVQIGFNPKEFGHEWDKVVKAIHRLKCPPFEVKAIIGAANEFARNAARMRGTETLDQELVETLDASADELLRKVQRFTVRDQAQVDAIKAIKRFKSKVG